MSRNTNVKRTIVEAVPFYTVLPNTKLDFALYEKSGEDEFRKILAADTIYTSHQRRKLEEKGTAELYVSIKEKAQYYQYMEAQLRSIATSGSIPLRDKAMSIYDGASKIIENIFEDPESREYAEKVRILAESTADVLMSNAGATRSLIEVGSFDYTTHTHSVDVAVFATGFGKHLGMNRDELARLGYSAMMHDVGKSRVPEKIINKKGRLSQDEFEEVQRHATYGYFILKALNETDTDVLGGVRYHHEKYDGSGYPERRRGEEIPLFAQIIGISDVYSALSTRRTYKDAHSPYEALTVMKNEMLNSFNKRLLLEFIRFMGPNSLDQYPV